LPPVAVCGPHHTHTLHILQQCGPHSTSFLARSRSLALRSSPRLCSARFARCTLATSPAARSVCLASAGSRCSPPRLLLSLRSCFACCLAPVPCFARAFCSLRSPARLLLAALALPAAHFSLLRLLRSPPRQLLSLRVPPRPRLLAASPAAARFPRRLTYSPASLSFSPRLPAFLARAPVDGIY
jgi:hypothetical protein